VVVGNVGDVDVLPVALSNESAPGGANATANGVAATKGTIARSRAPFTTNAGLRLNTTADPSDATVPGVHGPL
jgi:hypothetical protein